MIRKAIIYISLLVSLSSLLACSYLRLYPSWHHITIVRTDSVYAEVEIVDGVINLSYSHSVNPRILDDMEETVEYFKERLKSSDKRRKPIPLLSFGFEWRKSYTPMEFFKSQVEITYIQFPLFIPAMIFATYPTIAFIRGPLRRYRRRRKGLCVQCGYNLTGNTTGICSECGAEIQP